MRAWKIVALIVLALLLAATIAQLARWKRARAIDPDATFLMPRLQVASVEIDRIGPEVMDMTVSIQLDDPLPVGFAADSFAYRFSIGGMEIMKSTGPSALAVPGWDTGIVVLPVRLKVERTMRILDSLEDHGIDSVEYAIAMRFRPRLPLIRDPELDLRTSRRLPAFRIPDVHIVATRVEKFGLGTSRIVMDVQVANRNRMDLAFKDTEYTLRVEEDELMGSRRDDTIRIPAMDTVTVALPLEVEPGHIAEAIIELLLAPRRTEYSFRLNTIAVSDQGSIDGAVLQVTSAGTLPELLRDR